MRLRITIALFVGFWAGVVLGASLCRYLNH